MHPILLHIGSFSIKTYGFLIATGFLIGITFSLKEARRLNYDPQFILDLSFYIILGAIVGSRLYFVLTNLGFFWKNPLDVFKVWQGGLTFFGGFILAFAICIWMIKRSGLKIWKTLDLFAPSLAIGIFFGRLGCFFAGCCYGKPCSLPWAVTFANPETLARANVPLHPTQLYSASGAVVAFLVLFFFRKKKTFDGQLTLMWIILYSSFRVVNEQFRGDIRGGMINGEFSISLLIAIALIIMSVVLFPILKKKNPI